MHLFTSFLHTHSHLEFFISSFFAGEVTLFAGAFLASHKIFSFPEIFLMGFAATVLFDSIIFFLGKSLFERNGYITRYRHKHPSLFSSLDTMTGKHPLSILLYNKFLFGTRTVSTLLLSIRKVSAKHFLLYESLGTIIWLTAILSIGYLTGRGIKQVSSLTYRIEIIATMIVLFVIITRLVAKNLHNRTEKK